MLLDSGKKCHSIHRDSETEKVPRYSDRWMVCSMCDEDG